MNRTPLALLATAALGATAIVAPAQTQNLGLGVSIGFYFPSSTRVRNAFGDQLLNYGLGATGTNLPTNGSLTPSLALLNGNENGNKLFIGSFTYGYQYNLARPGKSLTPYIRPFAGLSYFDFGITEDTGRVSLKRVGYNYGLEAGIVISSRIRVAANYSVYSSEDSFNFNGFSIFLSYSFM